MASSAAVMSPHRMPAASRARGGGRGARAWAVTRASVVTMKTSAAVAHRLADAAATSDARVMDIVCVRWGANVSARWLE